MNNFNLKSYFTFLSRNKTYTAVNVFGLAVSLMFVIIIGLYTWQETSIDRQHSKAKRIYSIGTSNDDDGQRYAGSSHALLKYMQKRYPEIESTCAFIRGSLKLRERENFMNISTLETDSTFFSMFDFPLLYGNRATCLKEKGNIVITLRLARKYFGIDNAVGQQLITADSQHFRVTGVIADFDNTFINKDIDALIDFSYAEYDNAICIDKKFPQGNLSGTAAFVQVKEDCDFMQREADLRGFFKTLLPGDNSQNISTTITRLDNLYFSQTGFDKNLRFGNKKVVNILFAVGLVILLFSIINYINLTMAQSNYRAREMATRRVFGCTKSDVCKTIFTESLTMCALSCAVAVVMAMAFSRYAGQLLDTDISMSLLATPYAIFMFVVFIVAISLLAGLLPAVSLSKIQPIEVVRGTFIRHTKMVFARIFITVQNVITIVMLACALIMSLQMLHIVKAPIGFSTENLIRISQGSAFASKDFPVFLDKLRALPCVSGIASSWGTPVEGGINATKTSEDGKKSVNIQTFIVSPEFFDIYGIKLNRNNLLEGDSILYVNDKAMNILKIRPTDTHTGSVDQELDPFGILQHARFGGVFESFRTGSILNPDEPKAILVCKNVPAPWYVTIKVKGNPVEAYAQIKEIYKSIFHEEINEEGLPLVDKQIEQKFDQEIRTSKIVSLFAFIAIIISLLGLVAMSTYFIQQRAREIAIRKVFGSTGNQIRVRLIRTFMLYVGIAFVIAVPIVVHFMSKWIEQYSYRIVWWPWIVAAGVIVMLISLAAVAVQSWMASNENPVKNIRQE
ncbi:ABC transporter permease [Prevotella sp.]|uniref:ABC transporter permease n=1 Tax=Prevotella sp. TaxID=59823 RepID=UPI003AB69767